MEGWQQWAPRRENNNFSLARVDQLMDVSYSIQCAAVSPIGVLL
jgi:hypothetical protein